MSEEIPKRKNSDPKPKTNDNPIGAILFLLAIVAMFVAPMILIHIADTPRREAIAAFDKAWVEQRIEITIPPKPILLGEIGHPTQGSYPENVPDNDSGVSFSPRKATVNIQSNGRCENFRMPTDAPGVYFITKAREWEKIEIKMPVRANEYIEICSQVGYDVAVVYWAMKSEE